VSGSRGEQPREQLVAVSSVVSGSRLEQALLVRGCICCRGASAALLGLGGGGGPPALAFGCVMLGASPRAFRAVEAKLWVPDTAARHLANLGLPRPEPGSTLVLIPVCHSDQWRTGEPFWTFATPPPGIRVT